MRIARVDCDACGIAGSSMSSLALTYGKLGRHADALALKEKALEFFRRVLPEDHPDMGEADGL